MSMMDFLFGQRTPVVAKAEFSDKLTAGEQTYFNYEVRKSTGIALDIGNAMHGNVPVRGRVLVHPTDEPMVITFTMEPGGVVHRFTVEPKIKEPHLKIDLPRSTTLGDTLSMSWWSKDAVSVVVEVEDGNNTFQQTGNGTDGFNHIPQFPGTMFVRFTARSKYGIKTTMQEVKVIARKPVFKFDRPLVQAAAPGEVVSWNWSVTGADKVWVAGRGEVLNGFLTSTVWLQGDDHPEDLEVIGRGVGGETSVRLRVVPWRMASVT